MKGDCTTPSAAYADCNTAGSCAGGVVYNCNLFYNHLQNWNFDSACDWSYSGHATRQTDGQMCNGTGKVSQVVYIPAQGETEWFSNSTQWSVGYNLQFDDPQLESTNTFCVRVYDNATNTLIASGPLHRGSDGDPWCCQSLNPSGEAVVNVDNVELNQYYQ